MPASLCDLSAEILLLIAGLLDSQSVLDLSSTSFRLRNLLAPIAFKAILFTSDKRSAESACAAVRKYGQWTTELRFLGTSGPQTPRRLRFSWKSGVVNKGLSVEEEDGDDPEVDQDPFRDSTSASLGGPVWRKRRTLCEAAEELLKGIWTPRLEKIRLELVFGIEDNAANWIDDTPDLAWTRNIFMHYEHPWFTEEQEAGWRWRAFNAAAWRALSMNRTITKLTVRNFLPKPVTVFDEDSFKQFLGRLQEFDVSFYDDCKSMPALSTYVGYYDFLDRMSLDIFRHLKSVKHLRIEGTSWAPMRTRMNGASGLLLNEYCMSRLETLELQHYFIEPKLLDLICGAPVLKELSLLHCHCNPAPWELQDQMGWEIVFQRLVACETGLIKLDILPLIQPIRGTYNDSLLQNFRDEPQRRLFSYATVSGIYGKVYKELSENARRYEHRHDQMAYDEVLKLVKDNRDKARLADA